MSKIPNIHNGNPLMTPQPIKRDNTNLFRDNFNKALNKAEASATKPRDAQTLGEVRPPAFYTIENSSAEVVDRTSKLLDLLDNYAQDINHPDKTLKEIEPLILEIRNRATQLMKEAETGLGGDTGLKEIATRCALTANVEFIKFRRGDYI